MLVVAVCGRKRSGKDEIGSILANAYGYEIIKLATATPLKEGLKSLFGFDDVQMNGCTDAKEGIDARWGISPREALQFFGTEVMQYKLQELMPNVGRTFFVRSLLSTIAGTPTTKKFVITDVRFPHEVMELRKSYPKMLVLKVVKNVECVEKENEEEHASEKELDDIEEDLLIRILNPSGIGTLPNLPLGKVYRVIISGYVTCPIQHLITPLNIP